MRMPAACLDTRHDAFQAVLVVTDAKAHRPVKDARLLHRKAADTARRSTFARICRRLYLVHSRRM